MKIHVLKYKGGNGRYGFILANNELLTSAPLTDINKLFAFNLCLWSFTPFTAISIDHFISLYQATAIATLDVDVSDRIITNPKESLLKLKELIPEEFV